MCWILVDKFTTFRASTLAPTMASRLRGDLHRSTSARKSCIWIHWLGCPVTLSKLYSGSLVVMISSMSCDVMILCPSRVLANIITSRLWVASSWGRLLPEIQKKLKAHVVFVQLGVCPDFGWIIYIPVDIVRSWWSQWVVVMAAQHWYPWWRWSGLILCEDATLIRLWLHSLSGYLQIVVVEIFLQFP